MNTSEICRDSNPRSLKDILFTIRPVCRSGNTSFILDYKDNLYFCNLLIYFLKFLLTNFDNSLTDEIE